MAHRFGNDWAIDGHRWATDWCSRLDQEAKKTPDSGTGSLKTTENMAYTAKTGMDQDLHGAENRHKPQM